MGFTYSKTDWAGWTYNGEVDIQNNSKSMLIYTNDTTRNQYITSVSIRMGSGSGTFQYTDSEGVTHTHKASGKTYSAYMYGTGSDGVQVTSNTQDCSNLVTKGSSYSGLETKTFTFEPGIYVTPNSSVTLYMYFTMASKYATVVAYKYDYSATAKNIYTLTLNTSTGVASFTGGGSFVEGTAAPSTATASSGYTLSKYVGTLYDGSGDSEWTECAGLTTHNDSWIMYADRNVTAYASANTYNLTLNPNGGAFSNGSTSAATADPKLIYHGSNWCDVSGYTPARAGYTFAGWYTSASGGTKVYNANGTCVAGTNYWNRYNAYVYAGDLTVYARWTPISYTITYDAKGGSAVASQTYTIETNLSIAGASTKTGHSFSLWKVKTNSGNWTANTAYKASKNIGTGHYGNVTLVANWNVNNYTLTVNKGAGISAVSGGGTKAYGANCSISATANTGYTFSHWLYNNTNVSTSNPYTFTMPAGNRIYTAVGVGNTYYVKYDANGGSGSMSNTTHTYGTASQLRPNVFTNPGYEFKGWSTSKTATAAEYSDRASVSTLTSTNGATVTLYAVWSINTHAVVYGGYDGNYEPTINGIGSYDYGETYTIEAIYPAGCGYKFNAFYVAGVRQEENPYIGIMYDTDIEVTVYSDPISYTISYNSNGGNGTIANQVCNYGTSYNLTANAFIRPGYKFIGWSTSSNGSVIYNDRSLVQNLSAQDGNIITLYAIWEVTSTIFIWASNAAGQWGWRRALKYVYNTQLTSNLIAITINTTIASKTNYTWTLRDNGSLIATGNYSDGSKTLYVNKTSYENGLIVLSIDQGKLDSVSLTDQNGNLVSPAAGGSATKTNFIITAGISTVLINYNTVYYNLSINFTKSTAKYYIYEVNSNTLIGVDRNSQTFDLLPGGHYYDIKFAYADTYTYTFTSSAMTISKETIDVENGFYIVRCYIDAETNATLTVNLSIEIPKENSNLLDEGLLDVMQIF